MAAAVASGSLGVSASDVTVSVLPPRKEKEGKPAHIVNGKYINPWPSFRIFSPIKMPGFLLNNLVNSPKIPDTGDLATLIPWNIPTWGVGPENSDKIKATWLGHAAFLVELPAPPGALRGARILFDPVLSNRCSPSQWLGPARYTQAPCTTANIPVVDAIVISHNHYDHMDETTIKSLLELHSPQLFVPAGNEALVRSWGFTPSNSHALDWWDSREISLSLPSSTPDTHAIKTTFALTFTPSQHQANRGMFDRGSTLWGSWALEGPTNGEGEKVKVYFAGDTGYRTVKNGEDEDKVPVCPAFREIGEKFGGFDLALLPIGAYSPRDLMSCVHASPSDSVRIFQDVRAKRALAMHWGTWVLTPEPIMEPPQKLREETKKAGIAPDVFDICQLGETRLF